MGQPAAVLRDVVVVGAGLAGLRAVEALRGGGYDGRLTVVGEESHRPYDRPPLSKKVLSGEWEPDRAALRQPDQFDDLGVEWRLGQRATGLDTDARSLTLADGERLGWDGLVLALGAVPRQLPLDAELEGVFTLRTLDDSLSLRAALDAGPSRVVVIGAGFIGAEVASTARAKGVDVTVLEALPVPLARGLGPVMGAACAALVRDGGVDLRCGVSVEALVGDGDGKVAGVRLATGATIDAEVVVVGIGVTPDTTWLQGSGLTLGDGILCDAELGCGPPGVVAAGDCVRWPSAYAGEAVRVEHWTNAAEQGAHAATTLLARAAGDEGVPYHSVPFFWSDQFGHRIQMLGHAKPSDDVEVVHGTPDQHRFVALFARDGRLTAALGVDSPRLLMPFRQLLAHGTPMTEARTFAASQKA